jgi:cytochrome c oxidase accessory protein FixG
VVSNHLGQNEVGNVTGLYQEMEQWQVNVGGKTTHAKRMPGRFRTLKYITASLWLGFFLIPYIRWGDKQAILFDIPNRQFHFFSTTIMPQDMWMLSLLLLLLAMTLFAVTAVASRVFCGYFCFQTVWTDTFTWIEEKLEGSPFQRRKLDAGPWDARKIRIKVTKHVLWLTIAVLTGVSFSAWFTDSYEYWYSLTHLNLSLVPWVVLLMFIGGTYIFAGFMREQVCFWLCPYARIQAVMLDAQTVLPTYDFKRGEPRGKLHQYKEAGSESTKGDCIACFQCVQVCPTGVDIRDGQQIGCITCGLCIDACDSVMEKIGLPKGLIRYASLNEIEGRPVKKLYQKPRPLAYMLIFILATSGIVYGLSNLGSLKLRVIPERQPLFTELGNEMIENKYDVKVVNKQEKDRYVVVSVKSALRGYQLIGAEEPLLVKHGKDTAYTIYVKAPESGISSEITKITFRVQDRDDPKIFAEYDTRFNAPTSKYEAVEHAAEHENSSNELSK